MTRAWLAIAAPLVLAGCATAALDRNLDEVRAAARELTGAEPRLLATEEEERAAAALVDALLDQPLAANDAVRIALAASPAAQALMHENAAAMAAAIGSGRPLNPRFTFERLRRGEDLDLGRLLSIQLLDLVSWPQRNRVAAARLAQQRIEAIGDLVGVAAAARKAWIEAVAAQQALRYHRDVMEAAEAAAELARRMHGVGNFSRLQYAREQAFYADATAQLARAQHAALAARERLVRQLGLTREQARKLALPDRLPDLPAAPRPATETLQFALERRLDVLGARHALEHRARLAGLTQVRSVASTLELGIARNSATGAPPQRGYEVEIALPVFDAGDALRAEARASYLAAVHQTRQVIVDAHAAVAEAYHAYRTAYDLARHYRDEIVPLRQAIAEENLLRYNGMLIGVFELLADARERIGSVLAAIEALRDFWLADAALQTALIGRPQAPLRLFDQPAPRAAAGGAPH
jgi:outer membrane protein TolC